VPGNPREAEQGYDQARIQFAIMLLSDRGAPADSAEAACWFEKAATQGHCCAQAALKEIYVDVPAKTVFQYPRCRFVHHARNFSSQSPSERTSNTLFDLPCGITSSFLGQRNVM